MIQLPINGGYYQSDSLPLSNQQLTNFYVNAPQTELALSQAALFPCSGIKELASSGDLPTDINRGGHVKAGKPYFVNGGYLYRLDRTIDGLGVESFTLVQLGIITGSGRVSMSDNGKQLMLVTDGKGWIYDEAAGTPFQQITDPDFTANGTPEKVVFIDSFFVCSTDTKKLIKSAANDGLNWNALDFGSAEADPDSIVSPYVFKNQLYAFGSETVETFQNIGSGGFPFQKIQGFIINKGLTAPFGITDTTDGIVFLGAGTNETPAIWLSSGGQVQKLSTTAIDSAIAGYSLEDQQNTFAITYAQSGAYFVSFIFPRATFEYNFSSGKWNQRESRIINPNGLTEFVTWRAKSLVAAYGRLIVGDSQSGKIGELSRSVYTEYELPILRVLTTSPFQNQGNAFFLPQLELTMESGTSTDNTDQIVRLSTSKDGKTFNSEIDRSFGKTGEYQKRIIWRKLGRFARFSVLKFEVSAAVKTVIIKLEANIKGSANG